MIMDVFSCIAFSEELYSFLGFSSPVRMFVQRKSFCGQVRLALKCVNSASQDLVSMELLY